MKKYNRGFSEHIKELLALLPVMQEQLKELETIGEREINIHNIAEIVYLCDVLSENTKKLDSFGTEVKNLINGHLYSHLPFALSQLGLTKLETQIDRPDGDNRIYSVAVKSDISVKRIADDELIDRKLKDLGYSVSKPFIHASRLKSVVKDALEQGHDLSDIIETEKKWFVSFKEQSHG